MYTLPTAEILSGKNARAWVSMVLYLKKEMKIKISKQKNPGSRLEVACQIAQPIQSNLGENGLDWLSYLAGNFQTAPTIFFIFSGYFLCRISLRTHKPEMPAHFCHLIFQLQIVWLPMFVQLHILKGAQLPFYPSFFRQIDAKQ